MLLNSKGQEVNLPKDFSTFSAGKQEAILAPLREVLEPRSHKRAKGFNVEARAKLK